MGLWKIKIIPSLIASGMAHFRRGCHTQLLEDEIIIRLVPKSLQRVLTVVLLTAIKLLVLLCLSPILACAAWDFLDFLSCNGVSYFTSISFELSLSIIYLRWQQYPGGTIEHMVFRLISPRKLVYYYTIDKKGKMNQVKLTELNNVLSCTVRQL